MSSETTPPITDLAHGWTPERKALFLDHLSHKGNVRAAAARVGLSREAAYKIRRRDPLFARGWAAALSLAREACAEVLADRAIDGIEEKIYYRGELIDTRRKYDSRLLLAHIARLDKVVDADAAAQADADRFDELLACMAGEPVPEDLASDDRLPLGREEVAERAAETAERAVRYAEHAHESDSETKQGFDQTAFDAFEDECEAAYARGRVEGEARFDAWFANACDFVDALPGLVAVPLGAFATEESSVPRTVCNVSTAEPAAAVEASACS
jgi:hypothetical protein